MDMKFEQMVRERAYHIWVAAGMQDGLAHEHWLSAEQAVADEMGKPTKKAAAKSAASKKVPAAKKAPAKTAEKKPNAKSSKAKH